MLSLSHPCCSATLASNRPIPASPLGPALSAVQRAHQPCQSRMLSARTSSERAELPRLGERVVRREPPAASRRLIAHVTCMCLQPSHVTSGCCASLVELEPPPDSQPGGRPVTVSPRRVCCTGARVADSAALAVSRGCDLCHAVTGHAGERISCGICATVVSVNTVPLDAGKSSRHPRDTRAVRGFRADC